MRSTYESVSRLRQSSNTNTLYLSNPQYSSTLTWNIWGRNKCFPSCLAFVDHYATCMCNGVLYPLYPHHSPVAISPQWICLQLQFPPSNVLNVKDFSDLVWIPCKTFPGLSFPWASNLMNPNTSVNLWKWHCTEETLRTDLLKPPYQCIGGS